MTNSDLGGLYQELLLDHSRQRHGFGLQDDFVAESSQLNRSCGDEITLRVHGRGTTLESVSWVGQGCAISQASASMMCDVIHGLGVVDAHRRITAFREMLRSRGADEGSQELLGDAVALSGVSRYVPRIKCAMLAWVALEDAISRLPADGAVSVSTDQRG